MAFGIPDMMEMRSGYEYMDRLFAPEEWQELPAGVKGGFQNYMDYVHQFQRQQRAKRNAPSAMMGGTQRVQQGGTWSVAGVGTPISTAGSRQGTGAAVKGGSAIPSYRTHTGLGGEVTYETRGGRRKIGGEFIPTSMEEERQQAELGYAVPKIKATAEADYFTELNRAAQAKALSQMPKAVMEQERLRQLGQGVEQRGIAIDIAQQKVDDTNIRFYKGLKNKEDMARLQGDIRKGLLERTYELKGIDNTQKEELKSIRDYLMGNVPGSDQAVVKNREYAQRAMEITDNAFKNAITMQDKKEAFSAQRDIRNYISRLNILENSVYGSAKADVQGKQATAMERLDFTSEEEARSYGKKTGDIVTINGRKARLN